MLHGLKAVIDRLFRRAPDGTVPSVFGPDADRRRSDQATQNEWDLAAEIEKGRPRGF